MYTHTKIFYFTLVTFNVLSSYEAATVPDKAAAMSVDAEGRTVMYKKPRKEEKQDGDIGAEDEDTGVKDEDTGSGSAALAEVAADSGESEEKTHGQETDATEESSLGTITAVLGSGVFGKRVKRTCKSKKDCQEGQICYGEKGAKVCGTVEDAKAAGKAKGDKRRTEAAATAAAAQDVNLSDLPIFGETQGVEITINTGTARGIDAEVEAVLSKGKCSTPQCSCKAYYTEENKVWYEEQGLEPSKLQACKLEMIDDRKRKESSLPEWSNGKLTKCEPLDAKLTMAGTFDTAAKRFLGVENTCDAYAKPQKEGVSSDEGRLLGWAYGASIRNYYQVVNADIVIAVSYLTMGALPVFGKKGQVTSGTGMAVEFWRLKGKPGSVMYLYIDSRNIPGLGEISYLGEKKPLELYHWYKVLWDDQHKKPPALTVYDLIKGDKRAQHFAKLRAEKNFVFTAGELKTFGKRWELEVAVIGHDTPTDKAKTALRTAISSILEIR